MKCKKCEADVLDVFKYCHQCGNVLQSAGEKPAKEAKVVEVPQTFEQFRKSMSSKRQGNPRDKQDKTKKKKLEIPAEVMINVGIMKLVKGELKPVKGKAMIVRVLPDIRKQELLKKGIEKHAAYDMNFQPYENYVLLYPDGTEVLTLPGQPTQLFQLDKYKEDIGKPYSRISLYLIERELLDGHSDDTESGNSDPEDNPKSTSASKSISSSTGSPVPVVQGTTSDTQGSLSATTKKTQQQGTLTNDSPEASSKPFMIENDIRRLKDMFPKRNEAEIKEAIESTITLEDAANLLINQTDLSLNDAYASLLENADIFDDHTTIYHDDNFDDMYIPDETASTFSSDHTLQGLLTEKRKEELHNSEFMRLKIRRNAVWDDALFKRKRMRTEDLTKPLKVQFIGEPAVDHGGPLREFFSLVNSAAQSRLLCEGTFQHNISALNAKEFHFYGELTAIGFLQGFPGPKCFTKPVVDYILTGDISSLTPSVDDIPNSEVKNSLQNLIHITDEEEFKNQATFNSDYRFDAGYCKPFIYLKDKDDLCKSVALHHVLLSSITEANQYIEGLKACNMLGHFRDNPELFRKTFEKQKDLTAEFVDEIFNPEFSPKDSNKYAVEQKIAFNFTQYLEDVEQGNVKTTVEDKEITVCLKHVLQFVTGADDIPVIGFCPRPTIKFSHNAVPNRKLSANTCANILTIPVAGMREYSKFSEEFTFCMMNSPGFGVL